MRRMTLKFFGAAALLASSALLTTMASTHHIGKYDLGMIPAVLGITYNIPPPLPQPTSRPTRNTGSAAAIAVNSASGGSVSSSFAFTNGDYLIVNSSAGVTSGSAPDVSSVSGGGVSGGWHKLGAGKTTAVSGRSLAHEIWGGFATSSGTGSVTVNYTGIVVSGYILVTAYTGVNTTNPVADTVVQYVNNSATGAVPTWTNNCAFNNTLSIVGYAGGVTGSSWTPTHTNISEVQSGSMAVVASMWNGSINSGAITFTNSQSQANCIFINVNLKGTGGGS